VALPVAVASPIQPASESNQPARPTPADKTIRGGKKMRAMKALVLVVCSVAGMLAAVPVAKAESVNKKTIVTLTIRWSTGDQSWIPGTYIFQLADSNPTDNRADLDRRRRYLITTILAVPAYRQAVSDEAHLIL